MQERFRVVSCRPNLRTTILKSYINKSVWNEPWMTLGTLCLCLTCLWLVIHALNYFILTCHRPSVLPTFTTPRNRNTTQITLKHIHLRIQTTAWNSAHERLTSRLARKRYDAVRKGMCLFYNLGSGAGVVGMVLVICILGWTLGGLAVRLVRRFAVREDGVNGIVKRALEDTHVVQTVRTTSFIKPIVSFRRFSSFFLSFFLSFSLTDYHRSQV